MEPQPTPSAQCKPCSEIELWQAQGLSKAQQLERAAELARYHQQRLVYFQQIVIRLQESRHV
jgi:hypothetical protein